MPAPSRKRTQAAAPLDVDAWIDAAMDALAEGGVDAVRVDPLAKRLGVTRGSFYWHFKDRAALHLAMLKRWRESASYNVGERVRGATPRERLRRILKLPRNGPRAERAAAIEFSVRLWARRDANAARAVRHIDKVRLEYVERQFLENGERPAAARRRAYLYYAALMAEALIVIEDKQRAQLKLDQALLD